MKLKMGPDDATPSHTCEDYCQHIYRGAQEDSLGADEKSFQRADKRKGQTSYWPGWDRVGLDAEARRRGADTQAVFNDQPERETLAIIQGLKGSLK